MHLLSSRQQYKKASSYCLLALGLAAVTLSTSRALGQGSAPIADLAGKYIGYVSPTETRSIPDSVAPPPSLSAIPNEDLGARIDMTITSTGAVSGKMAFGPTIIPLAGALTITTNGQADVTLLLPITKYGRSVRLFLNPFTNQSNNGSLAYGLDSSASGGQYLAVYKNTWSSSTPPAYLTAYQTFLITSGKRVIISTGIPISGGPQGFGFGSIKGSGTSGNYNIAGTLADGNKFTSSGFYGSQGQVLIYQYLYASLGGGVINSLLSINSGNQNNIAQTTTATYIGGSYTWIKRPSPKRTIQPTTWKRFAPRPAASAVSADTLYPNGFYKYGSVDGSEYIAPAAGQLLSINGMTSQGSPASISTSVRFTHDSIYSINFSQGLTITSPSATSKVNQVSLTSPVRNSVRFTQFDVSTGQFKGTFTLTPPLRPATFEGMLVKNTYSSRYIGYGYFLIRDLKSTIQTVPDTAQLSDQRVSGSVYLGINEG